MTVSRLLAGIVGIHQAHGHMLAVRAEGHRLLAAQPRHEILVGPDEPVRLHGEDAGAEIVDDLVGAVRLGGNFRVEPNQAPHAPTTPP